MTPAHSAERAPVTEDARLPSRPPYVGPCPMTVRRSTMTDAEWEADVMELLGYPQNPVEPDPEDDQPDPPGVSLYDTPCPACGATGPCAYDANGLPLIHADEEIE